MTLPNFPKGFDSWQKTHFEVVEVLCYIRSLEEDKETKSFAEMVDMTATEDMYRLALNLTNKYEEQTVDKKEKELFLMKLKPLYGKKLNSLKNNLRFGRNTLVACSFRQRRNPMNTPQACSYLLSKLTHSFNSFSV